MLFLGISSSLLLYLEMNFIMIKFFVGCHSQAPSAHSGSQLGRIFEFFFIH